MLSNQLAPDMQGASLWINYKAWNETLESEVAAAVWFKKGDSVIRPKVTYAFTDHLEGHRRGRDLSRPVAEFFRPAEPYLNRLRRVTNRFLVPILSQEKNSWPQNPSNSSGSPAAPFAWQVMLTLEAKQILYTPRLLQASQGDHKKPDFLALNPRGKVPTMRDGDFVLYEIHRNHAIP